MGGSSAGGGSTGLTSCARVLIRGGADEGTGEVLSARVVAERAGWCAALAREMTAGLLAGHWNPEDVRALASGLDAAGRALPTQAWMALRRLGWGAAPPEGVHVNDRVARMAQEQAGRLLRSAAWRDALTAGVLAAWPQGDPAKRSPAEWDAVRAAVPGGERMPSPVIRSRTRQVQAFKKGHGRLPADVFELECPPGAGALLLLSACDKQEAVIERYATEPGLVLGAGSPGPAADGAARGGPASARAADREGKAAGGGSVHPGAAPRSGPGPRRDHDQHPQPAQAPGTRGGTRRRVPPRRPRHPAAWDGPQPGTHVR
jgi:hypothetical protein